AYKYRDATVRICERTEHDAKTQEKYKQDRLQNKQCAPDERDRFPNKHRGYYPQDQYKHRHRKERRDFAEPSGNIMGSQNDEVTWDMARKHPAEPEKADDVNRTGRHAQERREQERASPVSVSFVSDRLRRRLGRCVYYQPENRRDRDG